MFRSKLTPRAICCIGIFDPNISTKAFHVERFPDASILSTSNLLESCFRSKLSSRAIYHAGIFNLKISIEAFYVEISVQTHFDAGFATVSW